MMMQANPVTPVTTPESEFLSKLELRELTGAARASAQALWLRDHGVPFRQDGRRIIVSRFHVRQWLAGTYTPPSTGKINWDALDGNGNRLFIKGAR